MELTVSEQLRSGEARTMEMSAHSAARTKPVMQVSFPKLSNTPASPVLVWCRLNAEVHMALRIPHVRTLPGTEATDS